MTVVAATLPAPKRACTRKLMPRTIADYGGNLKVRSLSSLTHNHVPLIILPN
jgi:hypothetical protein